MKAMILAGGLSTRLYPLTKTVPKPLVPVLGQPNIAHVIAYLKSYGITEIATNVYYFADAIRGALGDGSRYGVHLTYLDEEELSGSAGAVKRMEHFLDSDPFVVIGCDDLTNLDLNAQLALHCGRDAIATIGLVERDDVSGYGVVVTDTHGRVVGFQEKPSPGTERSRLVNTGVYVFARAIFDEIPGGEVYDFGNQVFPKLQQSGAPFYGYEARGAYWCDIGTPAEYRRVTNDLLSGAFSLPDVRVAGNVWIDATSAIAIDATIVGPSVIGRGVVIEPRARIERCILWQNAVVGSDASLRDSIVGSSYRIAPGARLDCVVVANDGDPDSALSRVTSE